MRKQSRREFLKTMGVVAAGLAVPGKLRGQAQPNIYSAAVWAEQALAAYWTLDGELGETRHRLDGVAKGGQTVYANGPAGGQALSLADGRFVGLPPAPQLDTPMATVELFFNLPAPITAPYNPCLVAMRDGSKACRWSIHVMRDLGSLAVWNGSAIATIQPHDSRIETGKWYHLAVTSDGKSLRAYLDGVECAVTGSPLFNVAANGLPLQIGSSSPEGAELATAAIGHVAIYSAALPIESIAKHVDAAGWAERRKGIADAKKREQEEKMRRHSEKMQRRMNDPRLMARGKQRVYKGDNLSAIGICIGGIGAGTIQMNGKAERAQWQIFNNYAAGLLPDSFFAVRVSSGGEATVRALQTSKAGPFAPMADLSFRGEYPFAWYDFEDPGLPVKLGMEAFSPMVPLNTKDSSIPCAIYRLTAENKTDKPVEVTFLAAQQNAVGWNGTDPILSRRASGYGGNVNTIVPAKGADIIAMTSEQHPGSLALAAVGGSVVATTVWSFAGALFEQFLKDGDVPKPDALGPSRANQTSNAAMTIRLTLKPKAKGEAVFVLAWHFPGAPHGEGKWEHSGNMYENWWPNATEVAKYVVSHLGVLTDRTRLYHDTVYAGNLPQYVMDRVTSQVAILRSQTCFWAKDGYFGGWEGCNPGNGCCNGNCAHVWQYAQAHARLFPDIARKMREEVFGDQKPDGGLPHRQPGEFPATDGQFGDILGAYREHLGGTDGKWLREMWPKVAKAMEYCIKRWDPDEDGVLAGAQWNTLDGELGGSTTWLGSMYLASLSACERMAALVGESGERYRRIREAGAKKQDETLWNGEYYVQIPDTEPRQDYLDGCEIDQVLGEWWGLQLGLPAHYPEGHAKSALKAIVKHNFKPDFHGIVQAPRKFVDDDDAGTQMCCWPKNNRPSPHLQYADECMTGFEYSAAAAMIQFGILHEGLMLTLALADRYDGRQRKNLTAGEYNNWGFTGNPFGDDECGKFYARAMSSWSLLLACQGFTYDGPARAIGFAPVWQPEDHASFFTAAEGWGLFRQKVASGKQTETIDVRYGKLALRRLSFVPVSSTPRKIRVRHGRKTVAVKHTFAGGRVAVTFADELTVWAGEKLVVELA